MSDEKTSKCVASLAGQILHRLKDVSANDLILSMTHNKQADTFHVRVVCQVSELKSVCASDLTQTRNKTRGARA